MAIRTVPLHEVSPESHPEYDDMSLEDRLDLEFLIERLHTFLPAREYFVIKHRFGLEGVRAKTLQEIARRLGLTRERVRQIEAAALDRLRRRVTALYEPRAASISVARRGEAGAKPPGRPRGARPRPPALGADANGQEGPEPEVDEFLEQVFKSFTPRQASALRHYYGLCGHQPGSVDDVAQRLGLTRRKTLLAIQKGRRKLLCYCCGVPSSGVRRLRERIAADDSLNIRF